MKLKSLFAILGASALLPTIGQAQTARLKFVPTGAMPKLRGYRPQRLTLSATKPDALKKTPEGVLTPLYGVLMLGAKEKQTPVLVLVDEQEGKDARLFVDSNANGDLTDDPATKWEKRNYTSHGHNLC